MKRELGLVATTSPGGHEEAKSSQAYLQATLVDGTNKKSSADLARPSSLGARGSEELGGS